MSTFYNLEFFVAQQKNAFSTETNRFGDDINLHELVNTQTNHPTWGAFAADILQRGGPNPRNGNKSDAAHPPIHPLKVANK